MVGRSPVAQLTNRRSAPLPGDRVDRDTLPCVQGISVAAGSRPPQRPGVRAVRAHAQTAGRALAAARERPDAGDARARLLLRRRPAERGQHAAAGAAAGPAAL